MLRRVHQERMDTKEVEYYHILLDAHEILIANGAACESLHLGAQALKSVDPVRTKFGAIDLRLILQ